MTNPFVEALLNALVSKNETIRLAEGGELNIIRDKGRILLGVQDTFGDDAVVAILDQEVEQLRAVLAGLLEEDE